MSGVVDWGAAGVASQVSEIVMVDWFRVENERLELRNWVMVYKWLRHELP
jgi:hypothetical protein